MANLRLIYDNSADRAVLSADSTAGSLAVSNLQKNEKSAVWRSTSTNATITATWTNPEIVDSVALGWTNLTSLATISIKLYRTVTDVEPLTTYNVVPGNPQNLGDFNLGEAPLAFSGAWEAGQDQEGQVWLSQPQVVKKVEIVIDDPYNQAEYIEVSRLAVGVRYEMYMNPEWGARLRYVDRSKSERSESGNLRFEVQGIHRAVDFNFAYIERKDVEFLMRLASFGCANVLFVSLFPDTLDAKQSAYAFFASLDKGLDSAYVALGYWNNGITLEEIA